MTEVTKLLKNLALNWPSRYLPSTLYLLLLALYGFLFRVIGEKNALKWSYKKEKGKTLELIFWNGDRWWIVNYVRANRFLRGIDKAGARQVKRYHLDKVDFEFSDFVDVGANVGELSAYFAARNFKVYAFEPDPLIYSLLIKNLMRFPNVKASCEALDFENALKKFASKPESADSSLLIGADDKKLETVPTIRFEDHIFSSEIKYPSVLKMDTEGYEPEALLGFDRKINLFKFVAVDCGLERFGKPTFNEVSIILKDRGFRVENFAGDYILNAKI